MLDCIGITVADIEASVCFYEAVLAPLRFTLVSHDRLSAGFERADAAAFLFDPDGNTVESIVEG